MARARFVQVKPHADDMSFLRGSANYVWCTTSVLGKGATGAVFQGVNKNNGEPVAVKTFNQLSHMRPHDVQVREFEVLKKVKHENIVKLLAIEEEQDGRGKVIVMELCTGGSLFNILDDPENTYGLAESEFLLVLEHLSAGMKHLRDNNLVHRDLKPGRRSGITYENCRIIIGKSLKTLLLYVSCSYFSYHETIFHLILFGIGIV